jgi:hypothetical protein
MTFGVVLRGVMVITTALVVGISVMVEAAAPCEVTVETSLGLVVGEKIELNDAGLTPRLVRRFLGIPYSQPPVRSHIPHPTSHTCTAVYLFSSSLLSLFSSSSLSLSCSLPLDSLSGISVCLTALHAPSPTDGRAPMEAATDGCPVREGVLPGDRVARFMPQQALLPLALLPHLLDTVERTD